MSTPPVNSCNSSAGLIEKYINSAYDNVKAVADNLDNLEQIYQFLLEYGLITNIAIKAPVQAVATSPITLSGNQVLNWSAHSGDYSVLAATGMRVLVLGQTNPVDNGIYDVKDTAWTRSVDFDGPKDVVDGTLVFSSQGDVWQVDGPQYSLVPGTDPIVFKDIDLFAYEVLREATEKAQEAAASAAAALSSEQAAKASEDNAASSETHASDSAAAAAISEANAKVSEDAAKVSENNANASQIAAQNSASLAESVTNNTLTFATTAAGIAGTTDGQYFRVPQGSGATLSFIYYLNSSGTAQVVAEMPGKGTIVNNIRSYSSLSVAQADATAGNILNGAYCYVRNDIDKTLADEYINNSGTLEATGRSMPSAKGVSDGYTQLDNKLSATDGLIGELTMLPLTKTLNIVAIGDTKFNVGKESVLRINSLSAAATPDARNQRTTLKVTVSQNGASSVAAELLPAEYVENGVLNSPYHSAQLAKIKPGTIILDAAKSVARLIFSNVSLTNTYKSITSYAVIDKTGAFVSGNGSEYEADANYCGLYGNTDGTASLQLTFPYSVITGAGYDLTDDGIKSFFYNSFSDVKLWYRSTDVTQSTVVMATTLTPEEATVTVNSYLVINADVLFHDSISKQSEGSEPFTRYAADVVNDTSSDYSGLVELKVSFPQGLVYGHRCIKVSDSDGNTFDAQFSSDQFVNLRFQSNEGFWPDGSFKTGSVWINDAISAGAKKCYNVDLYGYKYDTNEYPALSYYANIEANKRYNLTVGGLTYRFSWAAHYYGLTSIDAAPNDDTNRVRVGISPQHRYLNSGSVVIEYFTNNVSLKVVNSGPLFTEVERVAYNAANPVMDAGVLKAVTRYRIFTTGKMLIKNSITAVEEIPVGKLYGATVPVNLYYQPGVTPVFSFQSPAAIIPGNLIGNGNFSIVPTIVNGDIHRDGTAGGPTRPSTIAMGNTPAQNLIATTAGWAYTSITDYSLLNWPVEKNWTWSVEIWLNANEIATDHFALATQVLNRPVGMAAPGRLPNYSVKMVEDELMLLMEGVADFWMNGDTAGIGGMTPPLNPNNPSNLTPFGYLAYRELVKKNGTLTTLLPVFTKYLDTNYNGTGLGAAYLAGTRSIADLVTTVFKPLSTFYRVAEYLGETTVTDALKPYIASVANAMVTTVTNKGGITNYYTDSGTGATNINIYGLLTVALAIHAGMDTSGNYQACYNTVIALLTNTSSIFRYTPTLVDSQPVTTSLSRSRWYNYDMDLAAEYLIMNDMLGGTPAFNNITYGLHGLCGDGRIRTIDYIISESRRGIISTPVSVALTMMMVRRVSTGNAAALCVKAYHEDYLTQPYTANRFYDHSPRLATGIPTTVSGHNRVMIEMLAGYFVHQLTKGKSVGTRV